LECLKKNKQTSKKKSLPQSCEPQKCSAAPSPKTTPKNMRQQPELMTYKVLAFNNFSRNADTHCGGEYND
jgi:hypothetical protein